MAKINFDNDAYNRVLNSFNSSTNNKNKSTSNKLTSKSSSKSSYSSSNQTPSNNFINQFDYYKSSYSKQLEEQEERRRQREEEEKKKKEQEEYYNSNKDTLIKQRTNSLIYNWDLDASGGQKYNYNNSKDTNTSDFYTNLGVQDLAINDFLLADEEAENKKKSKMWQDKENAKERFKNLSPLENKTTEASNIFNSITEQRTNTNIINPYENKDSYYKKYIEKFNTSIKNGNIKAANNALEKINNKYFGADYDDSMIGAFINNIYDSGDYDNLKNRFDTNIKKLEAINNSIANGTDDATLNKLKAEKSRLEFENQLIQYNKLTSIYSTNESYDTIENMYKKVDEPFKNINVKEFKWDKDKTLPQNIVDNFTNLTNRVIQTVGAISNAAMEMSFGSINTLLTNDIENEKAKQLTSGIIDFAEYLVPLVGKAKLYIDTASSGSVALPGLYDNLIAKPLGFEEQQSALLGENPNALQTLGSSIYVAMNFVLDALIKNSPLGKFSFDDKTTYEISKMTFGEIAKTLGITSIGEAAEEFFQAYGEDMMYGDKDRALKDVIFNKELRAQAFKNAIYAFIVSGAVGTTQVGRAKLKYKNNNITTNTKYAHINKTPEGAINVDSTSVEKVDNEKLTETLTNALQANNSVDIISTDIDNIDTDLDIEYEDATTNTDTTNTDTTEEVLSLINENTNIKKSNAEAITFDSTEKTILETMNNPTYYEARGLSENPTLQDIYELLVNNNDPMADKLFYYNELYGNRKYSTFLTNLNNGKITPELVAQQVLPENNKTNYSPNDIKNNTVTTVVPSQEMANYILTNNPNADVEVIDVKSPTFNEDVKNYVNGKATYNLNLNKKIQNEKSPTTVDSKTIKNLNTELSDLNKTLSKVEAKEDIPISKVKIDNSALASGNFVDISNNVQENLLNTLDTENHLLEERRDHLKETLAILQKYNNETRTPIKQKGGKPVVFDKTGFNTYEATDTISTEDSTPAIVNSTGKFIYGNSEARLNLSERAVNKINLMIDKLQLNGDKLTTRSTHKDVADLINKNKDMSKEILQILGYDGVLTGKQKTKLITATDNNDTVDIDKVFSETTKQVDEIIAAEKEGSSKESFIAMMQIARETLQGETKTKPVKTGSKQIDSTKSSIRVKSDLNLDNKTITETKLDATQSDIKSDKLLNNKPLLQNSNGELIEVYHGTDSKLIGNKLSTNYSGKKIAPNNDLPRLNFTTNKEAAKTYSLNSNLKYTENSQVISGYIAMNNPLTIDANGNSFISIEHNIADLKQDSSDIGLKKNVTNIDNIAKYAKENGYDGLIVNNVLDTYHTPTYSEWATLHSNEIGFEINEKGQKIVDAKKTQDHLHNYFLGTDYIVFDDSQFITKEEYNKINKDLNIKNITTDNLGNKLSTKDKNFIKNSKVVNEIGQPKMVYRGSNADKILSNTTNSKEKISFFSDDADIADSYRNSIDGKQYSAYINIENPYIIDANGAMFNRIKSNIGNTTDDIVNSVLELNKTSNKKYDGLIFNNVLDRGPYYHKKLGNKLSTVYVTFNSNQINIKNTDINTKTKNIETPTPIKSEVTVKTKNIEIKGNPETISVDTLQDIEEAFNEVSVHNKKSTKNLKSSFSKLYSAVFDRYSPILKIANEKSNLDVKNAISDLWTIRNRVHNSVKVEQTDINGDAVGKSLDTIKKQIKKQDLNDFQKAARAILNVERLKNSQEPILNLDAKKSQQYYDSMIKKHPYFKNVFDDLRVWNTNNTQKLYDAGLINIKQKQALDNSYKIYVPIYSAEPSDFNDIGEKSYNTKLKANDTLKPTTKQGKSILDIWTAFVVQEQNLESSILKNNAYKAMADSKLYSIDTNGKNIGTDIIYYDNGKINKFTTSDDIANVFQKYNIEKTLDDIFSVPVLNWFPKLKTKVQQKMLTSYDPIYTANNMLRDFGDSALFYSKYPLKFAKNYIRAAYNVANNSVLYQEIANTGIIPKTASTNKFTRILTSIESLPKMSEYLSAIESGKTSTEAKLEAQDVNLNFARGGYATQALNSKGWLFLNASAQALDKTASTIKYDIGKVKTNPVEGSLNLLLKAGAMSAPAMLNALMNQDDDDYEKLPYYYKNNYYMIKLGDNKFLRIPKGRIVGLVDTLVRYATGIDEEIDLKTYLESIKSSLETSVLPQDLIESGPFAEFIAIKNNKNYYGAEIYNEDAPLDEQAFSVINYISMNIFGRYGKAFKNLMDGDSTTDIFDVNSYVFDSTKYDKNLSSVYDLRDKYQYQKKNDDNMSFENKVMKKYIDTKMYAINSISGDINKQKANGATLEDMKELYATRDALTQDTIDNYNRFEIDKSGDVWTIYFDDVTYTYNPEKDEFKKLKN